MVRLSGRAALTALMLVWPFGPAAAEQSPGPVAERDRRTGGRLLDVPYVAQSVDLCGGAALAMVLRYWGDRVTVAEDFADLVDPDEGGIRTGRLVDAARARGWEALTLGSASADLARSHVERGRPPIALIEVGPATFHYVVIVAWTPTHVVAHDPARAPFRMFTHAQFDRQWAAAGRWLLLVLPPQGQAAAAPPETAASRAVPDAGGERSASPDPVELEPCRDLLAHGVTLAASRDLRAAEQALTTATERCPAAAAVWRELAGVRFLQQNWPDAARHAARAVDLAPSDELGWRILAAARYQQSDWSGALHAMRAAGDVSIDLIEVSGATRTPHPVVVETTGLSPGTPITAEAFDRAARRLNDLPVAMRSRLAYRPTDTGAMTVEAVIAERDGWPRRWTGWAAVTVRAAADRLLRIELGGLASSGELLTGLWRWSSRRPMGGFRLATPAPGRLPGVAMVEATWERQTYGVPAVDELTVASRRRVGFLLSDWASGSLRWEAEAAADRFDGRQHAAIGGALEFQGPADRLAVRAAAAGWGRPGSAPFSTASIDAAARLFGSRTDPSLSTQAGVAIASSGAPLALWPGAGTGEARSGRLRAHPLLADEVLAGEAFGRRLWHGTVEYAHPVFRHPAADVALIGFADAARAWHGLADPGAPSIVHVDVGVGARISTPGLRGSLDVNVAYGTRDGRVAVSAGVRAPWPSLGHWRDR